MLENHKKNLLGQFTLCSLIFHQNAFFVCLQKSCKVGRQPKLFKEENVRTWVEDFAKRISWRIKVWKFTKIPLLWTIVWDCLPDHYFLFFFWQSSFVMSICSRDNVGAQMCEKRTNAWHTVRECITKLLKYWSFDEREAFFLILLLLQKVSDVILKSNTNGWKAATFATC